jgi:apolipoprotein N-acyltransferase
MMQTATLPDAGFPGDELRYVTEHFRDLQGLRFAPFWTAGLVVAIMLPFFPLSRLHTVEMLIIGFLALAVIWIPSSHAWYRRHYGTIVAPVPRQPAPGLGLVMVGFLVAFAGSALFSSLDRYRGAFNLWLVLIWMLPICLLRRTAESPHPPAPRSLLSRLLDPLLDSWQHSLPASVEMAGDIEHMRHAAGAEPLRPLVASPFPPSRRCGGLQ